MNRRPVTLAGAVVLTAVIGGGIAFAGAILLVVAAGGAGTLPAGPAAPIVALLGATGIASAALTFIVAVGLWARRPWGWAGSLAIAVVGVIGAFVALATSGAASQAPLAAGLSLTVLAVASLLAPQTRGAAGIH